MAVGEGDVERLPPLGALPLARHLFPIPLQATCSLFDPPKYCFLCLGDVRKEPLFPMLCPHCQTPAVPGLCRAEQPQDNPGAHQRAQTWCQRPIPQPRLLQLRGGRKKNPCVVLNVDQKKSGVQIRVGKIANLNLLVRGNCSWLKHYCIPDIFL